MDTNVTGLTISLPTADPDPVVVEFTVDENMTYGSTITITTTTTNTEVMSATSYAIDDFTYTESPMPMPVIVSFETISVPNGEGAGTVVDETCNAGDYISAPDPAPTNEGYVLENWYDSYDAMEGYGNVFDFDTTPIEGDTTLYAKWAAVTNYTVSFYDEDGTTTLETAQTVSTGNTATVPDPEPTKAGYIFSAWDVGELDQGTNIVSDTGVAYDFGRVFGDVNLIAVFTAEPEPPAEQPGE